MSKLDKEFKNEINQEFREADYVGRKVGIRVFIIVLIIVILSSIGGISYKKWKTEKDREIFKESTTYTESASAFLAKSLKEYNQAEDEISKKAIADYVIQRYPNLDLEDIDNVDLRNFYRQCMNGGF